MSYTNNWANPSKAGRQEIAEMASALEERGKAPDQQQVNSALMSILSLTPGDHIFEAGCGSGLLCRLMAAAVIPGGGITGLDISPELISIAQSHARKADLAHLIRWSAGRAETLPFRDSSFDRALAARLLLHVPNPEAVLSELSRVLRPGGILVTMDWDFETAVVDHSDRELTRRLLNWRCDHYGGNNWSGRQLWRQMAAAGLSNLKLFPCASIARNEKDSLTLSLFRAAQVAMDGGAITIDEHDAWVGELKSALKAGSFFASIVYFIVSGEK
jgi:ubiquinone/menaquinone biosynthesis C-methylase UbiE